MSACHWSNGLPPKFEIAFSVFEKTRVNAGKNSVDYLVTRIFKESNSK